MFNSFLTRQKETVYITCISTLFEERLYKISLLILFKIPTKSKDDNNSCAISENPFPNCCAFSGNSSVIKNSFIVKNSKLTKEFHKKTSKRNFLRPKTMYFYFNSRLF